MGTAAIIQAPGSCQCVAYQSCPISCHPCPLPTGIRLDWTSNGVHFDPSGFVEIPFDVGTGQWDFQFGIIGGSTSLGGGYTLQPDTSVYCTAGPGANQYLFVHISPPIGGLFGGRGTIGAYTCTPLSLPFTPDATLAGFGFTGFTVTPASPLPYPPHCCDVTPNVKGCGSPALPLQNATVTAWTDSSQTVIVDQDTTDASGNAPLDVLSFTTYYWTYAAPRFTTQAGNAANGCGSTPSKTLAVAAGYHCITGCAYPEPGTLHCTYANAGAQVFSWTGTVWQASFTYLGDAYVCTYTTAGAYSVTKNGVACGGESATLVSCYVPSVSGFYASLNSGACDAALGPGVLVE